MEKATKGGGGGGGGGGGCKGNKKSGKGGGAPPEQLTAKESKARRKAEREAMEAARKGEVDTMMRVRTCWDSLLTYDGGASL